MIYQLANDDLAVRVSSLGAELCSISCKGREYLWQADPVFWKRHSPVLFPIVGSLWNGTYRTGGSSYSLSQHGFARDMEFEKIYSAPDELRFTLRSSKETLMKYPFCFELQIAYRLTGRTIEVIWEVANTGQDVMPFQIGAHPAFYFPDFNPSEDLKGYFRLDAESPRYILVAEKGCADPSKEYELELHDGLMRIDRHTFDRDALIFEGGQIHKVTLCDKSGNPHVTLSFDAPLVGLWSPPGKDAPFVCIEPWYGRCDRVGYEGDFEGRDWVQLLKPGDRFRTSYVIEIIPN